MDSIQMMGFPSTDRLTLGATGLPVINEELILEAGADFESALGVALSEGADKEVNPDGLIAQVVMLDLNLSPKPIVDLGAVNADYTAEPEWSIEALIGGNNGARPHNLSRELAGHYHTGGDCFAEPGPMADLLAPERAIAVDRVSTFRDDVPLDTGVGELAPVVVDEGEDAEPQLFGLTSEKENFDSGLGESRAPRPAPEVPVLDSEERAEVNPVNRARPELADLAKPGDLPNRGQDMAKPGVASTVSDGVGIAASTPEAAARTRAGSMYQGKGMGRREDPVSSGGRPNGVVPPVKLDRPAFGVEPVPTRIEPFLGARVGPSLSIPQDVILPMGKPLVVNPELGLKAADLSFELAPPDLDGATLVPAIANRMVRESVTFPVVPIVSVTMPNAPVESFEGPDVELAVEPGISAAAGIDDEFSATMNTADQGEQMDSKSGESHKTLEPKLVKLIREVEETFESRVLEVAPSDSLSTDSIAVDHMAPAETNELSEVRRSESPLDAKARELAAERAVREAREPVAQAVADLAAARRPMTMKFELNPPEMGSIEVSVRLAMNAVDVNLQASDDSVRQALNNNRGELVQQIESKGATVATMTVGSQTAQTMPDGHGNRGQQMNQQDLRQAANLAQFSGEPESDSRVAPSYGFARSGSVDLAA